MLKNTTEQFGSLAKLFHWLAAVAIISLFGWGVWMVDLGYYDEWYHEAPHYHKSVGILLAVLMVARLIWRFFDPIPKPVRTHQKFEKIAAKLTHWVIYLLVFAIITSGYLISTADGSGIDVFEWFTIPALGQGFDQQEDIAGDIHEWLAYILIGLASVHALAALKHHFIDKDDTLKRIL